MIKTALVLLFALPAHATTWQAYTSNAEGVRQMEKKNFYPAYQSFLKALEDDPLSWQVQMNLGLVFEANEEYSKAVKAYTGAAHIAKEGSEERFSSLFNLGGALAKEQKIEEALKAYQAALDIKPDSLEVKNNIELLWQGGGGGGKGDNQNKDKKEQQQGNNQQQREDSLKNPQKEEKQKPQPKPFDSEDLSKEDVKRILDEIKNQEQSIRANEYQKGGKEASKGKDW
ncbi:MAG: tetratricopeptide repeat protein [Bdellovibrionales bacterium]|nr:tetratricopeptide repeat protein [Bdellovibrionales bacterium]